MDNRSAFIVQILEKLGSPLMAAVNDVSARADGKKEDTLTQEAETVAELLGKSVQLSVSVANIIDLKETGQEADSVRLALAALASPLVAGHYKTTGKMPNDNDLKRISTALESVLTFADNFAPSVETIKRLEHSEPGSAAIADEHQMAVQYLCALAPVVNAIAHFSFGQPDQKLAQDVVRRLTERATVIRGKIVESGGDEPAEKLAELQCFKALVEIYVSCHMAETDRLMKMKEDERGEATSIDPVWKEFDRQAEMLAVLSESSVPGTAEEEKPASKPEPEPQAPEPEPKEEAKEAPEPPAAEAPAEEPPAPEPEPEQVSPPPPPPAVEAAGEEEAPAEEDGNFNPMGFFKKPPPEEGPSFADEEDEK